MPRYGVVLFDLDGTLTDPGVGITRSVLYALERLGESVPELEAARPTFRVRSVAELDRLLIDFTA